MVQCLTRLRGIRVRKTAIGICVALLLFAFTLAASAQEARLHPALAEWLAAGGSADVVGQSLSLAPLVSASGMEFVISPTGETRAKVLVRTTQEISRSKFLGIPVSSVAGDIASLAVTAEELSRLVADDRVVYVEPSWKTRVALDRSVPAVGGEQAHEETPPVLGEGVVIGFVDTGIDYEHLDFRYDGDGNGSEESTRILAIWDQTWGLFGTTYTREAIESDLALGLGPSEGFVRERDQDGHGTHVASIAAGDGSSSSYGFIGMAPAAQIVSVKTSFYTADILEGAAYVFDEADQVGLPAVVNLSLGGHEGPHDGTSLFEQGLDELVSGPGRAIVVSAGNEGDESIHVSGTLRGGSRSFDLLPDGWQIELDLWYPGTSQFEISVSSSSGTVATVPTGISSGFVAAGNALVYVDNASEGVNPNNGDREVWIRVSGTAAGERWQVTVRDAGGGGRFDAWVVTSVGTIDGGDSSSTIDEPGNADRVITVGSFNTKSVWPSLAGEQDFSDDYPLNVLSSFSSQGPTRDGRMKPDIAAPGAWICAALSSSATEIGYLVNPDGVHTMELGTSMAAPHVSGAVALLLSVNPNLTFSEIRTALVDGATSDGYTGSVPNVRWGWGKLNVLTSLDEIEPFQPPSTDETRPTIAVKENPVRTEAVFEYALLASTGRAELNVYTASGVRVHSAPLSTTKTEYTWDLRLSDGDRVASGLYLYVLVTDQGTSEVGKLVISP
jgi:subtilisin family serine protease